MKDIHKLQIYLNSSTFIEGEFKLKIYTYKVEKETPKMITILDGVRSVTRNKEDINVVKTDFRNDTFISICFYCFCYTDAIEEMTEKLINKTKEQFSINEELYNSSKEALNKKLNIIHVI